MSRALLLDAVRAAAPDSADWVAAVTALGRFVRTPPVPKRGTPTGLTRGELYARLLRSHVFDEDRSEWQSRWWHSPGATTFDELKRTLETRKQTEKTAHA